MDWDGPTGYRSHSAIAFTAGLLRVLSIVCAIGAVLSGAVIISASGSAVFGLAGLGIGLVQAIVLWALADAMTLLVDGDHSHVRLEQIVGQLLARSRAGETSRAMDHAATARPAVTLSAPHAAAVPAPTFTKEPKVMRPDAAPGYRPYPQRSMTRVIADASLRESPRDWAPAVLAVKAGDSIAVLGEVGWFVFAETGAGDGWLAKEAIAP